MAEEEAAEGTAEPRTRGLRPPWTPEEAREMARLGGAARWKKERERKEAAKEAARATTPKAPAPPVVGAARASWQTLRRGLDAFATGDAASSGKAKDQAEALAVLADLALRLQGAADRARPGPVASTTGGAAAARVEAARRRAVGFSEPHETPPPTVTKGANEGGETPPDDVA